MSEARILLVDDHALIRAGFRALLRELGCQVVGEASNANEALRLVELHKPDVVLLDISMPGLSGLEAIALLPEKSPTVRVVIISMYANAEYARRALRAGAVGYLLKNSSAAELDLAIKTALQGETYLSPTIATLVATGYARRGSDQASPLERLTPRQLEILQLLAKGYTRKQIGEKLFISVKTFDTYRAQLMQQLEITDVAGLVRYATQMGLVTPDE